MSFNKSFFTVDENESQVQSVPKSPVKEVFKTHPGKLESDLEFCQFFDNSDTFDNIIRMGYIDFAHRIFTPDFYQLIGDPRKKVAMEIGFGAGRLINAASKYFENVIGIDIHESFDRTRSILKGLDCENYELLKSERIQDIPDNSIDFVYSFIVFQHFTGWREAIEYFECIKRVLKPEGAGIIYFGINNRTHEDCWEAGGEDFEEKGYSLVVKPDFAINKMKEYVEVLQASQPQKRPWDSQLSSQFYVKFASKDHSLFANR
jgi:SAM-dependent methyltransferase